MDSNSESSDSSSSLSSISSDEVKGQQTEKVQTKVDSFPTAKKYFIAGQVIEDKCLPITKTIEEMFRNEFCNNCMKKCPQPKKCANCHQLYYCDKICQRKDWKYHKNECKVFCHKKFKSNECLTTERLLMRLWLTIDSDPSYATVKHRLFDGTEVSISDIEVNTNQLSADIERMVEFRMICNHFTNYGLKFDPKTLLRYYGFVVFNKMRRSLFHYFYDLTRNAVGVGVYLQLSNFDHSCNANTAYVNSGFRLQVRAMKSIESNEEMTISYLDLAKDKTERDKTLKAFFYIDCKCDKCQQNLDSDIDYREFSTGLYQIYEISNYGELFGDSYLSSIDTNQALRTFAKMSGLYCRIYGPYHPSMTGFLLQQLLAIWRLSNCSSKKAKLMANKDVLKELYNVCEANLKVTHGDDHYFYGLFRKFKIF